MALTVDQTLQQANAAHKEGKFDEAEHLYVDILKIQPTNLNANNQLSILLSNLGRFAEAEKSFKKVIELKPDYAEGYNHIGVLLEKLAKSEETIEQRNKKLEEAETNYKKAITLNSENAEIYCNLGNTLSKLKKLEEAETNYKKAIELKPNYIKAHYNLGTLLQKIYRFKEALKCFKKVIDLKPDFIEAHNSLGGVYHASGRLEDAVVSFKNVLKWKPDNEEAKHMLAALTGETTKSAPRIYVEKLFDNYASNFDNSLVKKLEYKVPKNITDMIIRKNPNASLGSILDLGCGTGLTGVEIRKFCRKLEGIDLSSSMLQQARNKNVYDKLVHRDIKDYLLTEKLDFDYFILTDVFIYVGDLTNIFHLIKSRNNSEGKLVFSTEHTDKDGFVLEKSGRYSHSKMYIEGLCKKFNYKLSCFEKLDLRKENKKFLVSGLYLLNF